MSEISEERDYLENMVTIPAGVPHPCTDHGKNSGNLNLRVDDATHPLLPPPPHSVCLSFLPPYASQSAGFLLM